MSERNFRASDITDYEDRPNPYVKDDGPRVTQPYSIISEKFEKEDVKMALSVKNVIFDFIEKNVEAWQALPLTVRELMVKSPEKFQFSTFLDSVRAKHVRLVYNKVTLEYNPSVGAWRLESVEE